MPICHLSFIPNYRIFFETLIIRNIVQVIICFASDCPSFFSLAPLFISPLFFWCDTSLGPSSPHLTGLVVLWMGFTKLVQIEFVLWQYCHYLLHWKCLLHNSKKVDSLYHHHDPSHFRDHTNFTTLPSNSTLFNFYFLIYKSITKKK